jgi:NADPH-dependent 2,4-dienoyl-CoA reductase/sulfur reductase-like enzyme
VPAALVVVGASLAGLRAVESARRSGYDGRLVLVGAEPHLPYERPPLSKAFLAAGPADAPAPHHLDEPALAALDVELRLGTPATGLDLGAQEVVLGDERLPYAALVVATGAHARRLPFAVPAGVHVLRGLDDARALRADLDRATRVVVVGGGFVGSEVASAARDRGLAVTVVEAAPVPLVRAVGADVAPLCAALHARAGTDLRVGTGVTAIEGDGRVETVVLSDGSRLPADVVVIGIGTAPTTDWLHGSGLALDDGLICGPDLLASAPGVWAAGDVARVTTPAGTVRLEHWTSAAEQGRLAGANAVAALRGKPGAPYSSVPYFWSDCYGHKLQMLGLPQDAEAEVHGDADAGPWLALYRRGDRLAAVLTLDLPGRIMKFRPLLARGAGIDEARSLVSSRPLAASR